MTGAALTLPDGSLDHGESGPLGLRKRTFEILVVLGILLALLMGALDNFVALTALPTILNDFGQPTGGTFVISAYVIASTASIPVFAKFSDLWTGATSSSPASRCSWSARHFRA